MCGLDTWHSRRVCQNVQSNFPLESRRWNHKTPTSYYHIKDQSPVLTHLFQRCCAVFKCHCNNKEIIQSLLSSLSSLSHFPHLILHHWQSWVDFFGFRIVPHDGVEEWTGSDATSTEEITGICITPDRDGGMRQRRRNRGGGGGYLPLADLCGFVSETPSSYPSISEAVSHPPPPTPTGPSFLPAFITASKSLYS